MKKIDFPLDLQLLSPHGENRKFLTLTFLSTVVYAFIGWVIIQLLSPALSGLPAIGLILFRGLILIIWASIFIKYLLILLSLSLRRDFLFFHGRKQWFLSLTLPINMLIGRTIGWNKDSIRRSYIAFNNIFWGLQWRHIKAKRILVLLPHCLQWYDCAYKITHTINNCRACGKCDIGSIKELAARYPVSIAIATGGTLARKIIVDTRPSVIIAVACERDLSIGIQEVYPIPTFGILNQRPQGPCVNTRVIVGTIERLIRLLLQS